MQDHHHHQTAAQGLSSCGSFPAEENNLSEVRTARQRVLSYYRHLFPELAEQLEAVEEGTVSRSCFGEGGLISAAAAAAAADEAGGAPTGLLRVGVEPSPVVALDPALDLPAQLVNKGWTSQPQEFDYELEVEGQLPRELQGTLFRNGPICSIKFANGKAHFRSKYVKTTGYVMERKAKKLIFKGMMGTKPSPTWSESLSEWTEDVMRSKLPGQRFKNPANTNVYYWGGKLLATWESGLPYALDPATLETKGKDNLNGALKESRCLAAHFRYDPMTDRLVTFSFQLAMSGKCKLFVYEFSREWEMMRQRTLSIEQFYYCHDFLLTENYYIFHQSPFYKLSKTNVTKIISGVSAPGQLMHLYADVPSRMIIIPRDGSGQPRSFETEPCMIYHHCNAWEEGDKIHFSSVCLGKKFNMDFDQGMWLSNASAAPGLVFNYTINLKTGSIARIQADYCSCEFPSVHPDMAGQKWRFAYLMASDHPAKPIPFQEIVKFDREGHGRQVWSAREEFATLGEPVFVPRSGQMREDDGWVIAQLYNCKLHETAYVILDAQNLPAGPVARVKLAHHTPYGFHGTFTPEAMCGDGCVTGRLLPRDCSVDEGLRLEHIPNQQCRGKWR